MRAPAAPRRRARAAAAAAAPGCELLAACCAMMPVSLRVLLLSAVAWAAQACTTDLSCSLNGVCQSGTCQCDKPWSGTSCGVLKYKTTPASGKNLYNTSDPRNTWCVAFC
jgi:hypothetical protein